MKSGVPAQDNRIEAATVDTLIPISFKDRHQIEGVLETAAPPAAEVLAGDDPAGGYAC